MADRARQRAGKLSESGLCQPRAEFGEVADGLCDCPFTAEFHLAPDPCAIARSEAVDIGHGQLVRQGLKDVAIVMDLHELAPVGGRASGG